MTAVKVKQEPLAEMEDEEKGGEIVKRSVFESSYDRSQLPHLLRIYYTWLFPYDKYFDWLQYGSKDMFSHREFSFTLEDDIYVRYQSYDSREALEEGIRKAMPYKIDIGAIFSVKPSMKNRVQQTNFKPTKKELVFDIDMTDYDDIRTCCQEATICLLCWKFVTIAIRIIDRSLRDDFGFQHLLWVYSGRRGVHCWVCDREAMNLSPEARSAIVEYLSMVKGGEQQAQKVKLKTPYHPSIKHAEVIIDKYFSSLLEEQDFLSNPVRWSKMLALLPNKLASELDKEWKESPHSSSCDRWGRLMHEARDKTVTEIKFQWSYPRLDVNVSKGVNHLLKSPLCIHPKTGRVCVPIDISQLDSFNPLTVPTVSQICSEFETNSTADTKPHKLGYTKTSLKPYMEYFSQKFLIPLIKDNNTHRRKGPSLDF